VELSRYERDSAVPLSGGQLQPDTVQLSLLPLQVISDKKVLAFMLSQLLSNAFQYAAADQGVVSIVSWSDTRDEGKIHLAVRDNGKGVPPEDLPFLFDKGFTGSHPDRQNATGMG
jgi:signal transduction histidine kinase